ncbi:iron-containing redox enzyme family protein [Amnibacterium sp. CER49]|uniref:iron-containing redox enzyme family protein n=1 Tax=Amnibacterium sp. CER49 TaxID=3039161 RepID=UPI00244A5EC3|nr:iron-containing redox enzyme family protein [Amnibacterium sp. CER49]MDH2444208.1 iron-containing redox enzyme family protein [Amnibacterium sp. CER49]
MPATLLHDDVLQQRPMPLPAPRGAASGAVLDALQGEANGLDDAVDRALADTADILGDEDLQLALLLLYELHYGGLAGVDDGLEWSPQLLAARARIERDLEAAIRAVVRVPERPEPTAAAVAEALFALTGEDSGPSLSRYVARKATLEQLREFLVQRSIYTLKEADPHSFGIPRLTGRAKAALVEIQSDEYGGGRPGRIHSAIFARTMRALGLDDAVGAYLDLVPAVTLASLNTMSLFGLHRRLRGANVGHLAAFEMTSSLPNRQYGNGFRRHGFDEEATWYFDEHVEADAVHEQIAARDLAGGLVEGEPALLDDVLFGAAACLEMDGRAGAWILERWTAGESSLRAPVP